MTKNVTLSLPDELGNAMSKFPEVNWSAVARDAIEVYVKLREKPDLAPIIERLIQSRGQEYVSGVNAAKALAQNQGNRAVDIVVREYWRLYWIEAEKAYKEDTDGNFPSVDDVSLADEFLGNLMFQAIKKFDPSRIEESDAFMNGMRTTLLEVHKLVHQ